MNKKEDGGLAFPLHYEVFKKSEMMVHHEGMSLRDYFATHSPYTVKDAKDVYNMMNTEEIKSTSLHNISSILSDMNYNYADAMIKEKNK